MKTLNDARNDAHALVDDTADQIEDWAGQAEEGLVKVEDFVEEQIGRRIPWMKMLGYAVAGAAVVGGAIYLSRHRAQRVLLQKGVKAGLKNGAELALHLPGGLRKARESADMLIRESARLWDKIPVRVVMK